MIMHRKLLGNIPLERALNPQSRECASTGGKLDGKQSPPPKRARRHNPATIKVFLLLGRKGISTKGISPKDKANKGGLIFEPRNIPATQAQLT